jgi:hypothetical protein
MADPFKLQLGDGTEILIEQDEISEGLEKAGAIDYVKKTIKDVESSINDIHHYINQYTFFAKQYFVDTLKKTGASSIGIKFGIKISQEYGAILAKAGSSAHINISLTWDIDKSKETE